METVDQIIAKMELDVTPNSNIEEGLEEAMDTKTKGMGDIKTKGMVDTKIKGMVDTKIKGMVDTKTKGMVDTRTNKEFGEGDQTIEVNSEGMANIEAISTEVISIEAIIHSGRRRTAKQQRHQQMKKGKTILQQ